MKMKQHTATAARVNAKIDQVIARVPILRDVQAVSKEFWREVFECVRIIVSEFARLGRDLHALWRGHQKRCPKNTKRQ